MKRILTLCIIYQNEKVLLGMKKRGFGVGKWNGFGGHIEDDETIEKAAMREVFEEAGLKVKSLEKMGVITFEFQDGHQSFEVHIFRSKDFEGEITESGEMKPEWFNADNLPLDNMWTADAYWLPIMLKGKKFKGEFIYDRPSTADHSSRIIKENLREVNEVK